MNLTTASLFITLLMLTSAAQLAAQPEADMTVKVNAQVDFGADLGQNWGTVFEAKTADGRFVVGAGFQSAYNTMLRSDRYDLQFFIRPTDGAREFTVEALPRPFEVAGAYLGSVEGELRATTSAHSSGIMAWDAAKGSWERRDKDAATDMRIGDGVLEISDARAVYNGVSLLDPPKIGAYSGFFYANGFLVAYHRYDPTDKGYRPYESDENGFAKLYAFPWDPAQEGKIDESRAIVVNLPFVGAFPYAYGQAGNRIISCSNLGDVLTFDGVAWKTLNIPNMKVSYQVYSIINFYDRVFLAQYPSGLLLELKGDTIETLKDWPPRLEGVSGSSREAQTTAIYGGELYAGVWPWGELWRYSRDTEKWTFVRRMFTHPELTDKTIHPYENECKDLEIVQNQWGQRVTGLVPLGDALMVSTSAKWPCDWKPEFTFVPDGKWQEYGTVYRLTAPGTVTAPARWKQGGTAFEFVIAGGRMSVVQDGQVLGESLLPDGLAQAVAASGGLKDVAWGSGAFGPFGGRSVASLP